VIVGILSKLSGRRSANAAEPQWSIVKAINPVSSEAAVIRIRTDRPMDRLPTAIEISWPYLSEKLFPESDERQRMAAFEEAIDELTSENGHTELVQVSTGNGVKEWLFYSRDQAAFMDRMNTLLHDHPPYPVQIKFYEDADWQIWRETVEALNARNGG
jgi:hypothetical protein